MYTIRAQRFSFIAGEHHNTITMNKNMNCRLNAAYMSFSVVFVVAAAAGHGSSCPPRIRSDRSYDRVPYCNSMPTTITTANQYEPVNLCMPLPLPLFAFRTISSFSHSHSQSHLRRFSFQLSTHSIYCAICMCIDCF